MKFRALLLSSIMAVLSLSVCAAAQNDQQKDQPSSQTQAQAQQPASDQSQPVAQDQSANDQTDQAEASDKKDKKDKDKEKKDKKYKHDGGKDDVDAIGNRHVGGLDWYSTETDIKVGKMYAQQIEQSMKFITDPVVTEYVNRIGCGLRSEPAASAAC
jgi:hypothetical protein